MILVFLVLQLTTYSAYELEKMAPLPNIYIYNIAATIPLYLPFEL